LSTIDKVHCSQIHCAMRRNLSALQDMSLYAHLSRQSGATHAVARRWVLDLAGHVWVDSRADCLRSYCTSREESKTLDSSPSNDQEARTTRSSSALATIESRIAGHQKAAPRLFPIIKTCQELDELAFLSSTGNKILLILKGHNDLLGAWTPSWPQLPGYLCNKQDCVNQPRPLDSSKDVYSEEDINRALLRLGVFDWSQFESDEIHFWADSRPHHWHHSGNVDESVDLVGDQCFPHRSSFSDFLPWHDTLTARLSPWKAAGRRASETGRLILQALQNYIQEGSNWQPLDTKRGPENEVGLSQLLGEATATFPIVSPIQQPEPTGSARAEFPALQNLEISTSGYALTEDADSNLNSVSDHSDPMAAVLGAEAGRIKANVLSTYSMLIDDRLGISECPSGTNRATNSHCNAVGQSQAQASRSSNSQHSLPRNNKRARRRSADDDDDADDDQPSRRGPVDNGRSRNGTDSPARVACPYGKRYPVEFSTSKTCCGRGFIDFNKMK
jgi:hypothetical protein